MKIKTLKKEKKLEKNAKGNPKSKDGEEGGKDEEDGSHSKLTKSETSVNEVKAKILLPSACTSTDLDMYEIVDDDLPHGKRNVYCRRREKRTQAHALIPPQMSQTTRNTSPNGISG